VLLVLFRVLTFLGRNEGVAIFPRLRWPGVLDPACTHYTYTNTQNKAKVKLWLPYALSGTSTETPLLELILLGKD